MEATDNAQPWPELLNTVQYGEAWMAVTRHYFATIFNYLTWKAENKKDPQRKTKAQESLSQWKIAWQKMAQPATTPGAPTPMKDKGMEDLVAKAANELEES